MLSSRDVFRIGRFRSLPMSRWAVLAARSVAELPTQMIGAIGVAGVGLAIGWRVHTNAADVIAAFALALLFGYAFTWAGICLGLAGQRQLLRNVVTYCP
jgi:ABC-2 type transport system permease protein